MTRAGLTMTLALLAGPVWAQAAPETVYPQRIPSSGGEVIIPSAGARRAYDQINFAPARRAGDTLYVSGVLVGRAPDEGTDAAAFEGQVRRAFRHLDAVLRASGVTFDDVVMINSFHVWEGPNFTGTKDEQIAVINRIKAEFIKGPHPAWTAVGTTGLLGETAVVEIQLIAHAPQATQ